MNNLDDKFCVCIEEETNKRCTRYRVRGDIFCLKHKGLNGGVPRCRRTVEKYANSSPGTFLTDEDWDNYVRSDSSNRQQSGRSDRSDMRDRRRPLRREDRSMLALDMDMNMDLDMDRIGMGSRDYEMLGPMSRMDRDRMSRMQRENIEMEKMERDVREINRGMSSRGRDISHTRIGAPFNRSALTKYLTEGEIEELENELQNELNVESVKNDDIDEELEEAIRRSRMELELEGLEEIEELEELGISRGGKSSSNSGSSSMRRKFYE